MNYSLDTGGGAYLLNNIEKMEISPSYQTIHMTSMSFILYILDKLYPSLLFVLLLGTG
jgi:hypothetical protein